MGNCAAIQVGAYVDSCAGKPCSIACPTNPCALPGQVCNSGNCNDSINPNADCSLITNTCTPSCIDKATCQQCPYKPGCATPGVCSPACYTGEWCDAGTCKKISQLPNPVPIPTGCNPACGVGYTCYNTSCVKNVPVISSCPTTPCAGGYTCTNGVCNKDVVTTPIPGCNTPCSAGYICDTANNQCVLSTIIDEFDTYGCNKTKGETWCAAKGQCHIEYLNPCNAITPVGGGTIDSHGCDSNLGQSWCASKARCHVDAAETCDSSDIGTTIGDGISGLLGNQNSLMLVLGVALLGGFVIMSSRK